MVVDIEPVAHVFAATVDRQLFSFKDIVDYQRNQFLRELIGAVVVAASGYIDGQTVGLVIGEHKHVGRRFRR